MSVANLNNLIDDSDFEDLDGPQLISTLRRMSVDEIKNLHPGAVSIYNLSGLKFIIKKGYNVNTQSPKGLTLLHYYAKKNPLKSTEVAVKFLLENGIDPTIITKKGLTALNIATLYNKKVAKLLINFNI